MTAPNERAWPDEVECPGCGRWVYESDLRYIDGVCDNCLTDELGVDDDGSPREPQT